AEVFPFVIVLHSDDRLTGFLVLLHYLIEDVGCSGISQGKLVSSFDNMAHFKIIGVLRLQIWIAFFRSQRVDVEDKRIKQSIIWSGDPPVNIVVDGVFVAYLVLQIHARE